MDYIIAGDTERHNDCLVYVCGKSLETAEKTLARAKAEDSEYTNLRIEQVENVWWNDPFLAN